MTNIVIVSAARTAVGSFGGAFANTPADALGTSVLQAIVERGGIDPSEVSETILGQVLTAGQGQNPARQAHINAGLPIESAAWSINQVCGSGLRAVALAAQHIQLGDADIDAAGGQENMTLSPHVAHLRSGTKMGDVKYIDSMIRDGLWDAFNNYHMGQTAENVAAQWQISRDAQDEFALASQNKAEAAQKSGLQRITFSAQARTSTTVLPSSSFRLAGFWPLRKAKENKSPPPMWNTETIGMPCARPSEKTPGEGYPTSAWFWSTSLTVAVASDGPGSSVVSMSPK